MISQVDIAARLTREQCSEVLGLVGTATGVDEVAPLSEQVLLDVRDGLTADPADGPAGATSSHLLAYDGTHLAGYAHREAVAGEGATGELVVDPALRRQGVGTALIRTLEDAGFGDGQALRGETLRIWSHGNLPAARGFALRHGYSSVRELWQMCRSLGQAAVPLPAASLPEGFRTRDFVVGQDEDAWLRVNARAFVDHPEQGRMTRHDLDQRMAEPWFDAAGLILVEDSRGPSPVLAASHWTKIAAAGEPGTHAAPHRVGEVYVVGVDPAYQGLGLGGAVTVLGLAHLREQGVTEAMLYVDADNRAAVATYARLDFARCGVDIMYARTVHPPA